jgi:ABC-type transport system substrate-binding protein
MSATSVGAALLAACGGGDGTETDSSGLVSRVEDSSKDAKRGGTHRIWNSADPASLDYHQGAGSPIRLVGSNVYSRLFEAKPGHAGSAIEYVGSLVDSWEWSPDGTQMTAKLRDGVAWQNKPPVNGRVLDVNDVIFSWNRFAQLSVSRISFANAANPGAPIVSFTAIDPKTIAIKLARPTTYLPALLSALSSGTGVPIIPKEAESQLDLRFQMVGTGAFALTEYQPSVGFKMERHANYYMKGLPYVDSVELPIITEYATGMGQFRTGNLFTYDVRQEDVLATKRDVPDLKIYSKGISGNANSTVFGWRPAGKSMFLDERVRKAFSMAVDRDLWIDTVGNVEDHVAAGLDVEKRWNSTSMPCDYSGWLDPLGSDFGPNARFLQHNVAEAKSLLSAAGYPSGMDVNWYASVNFDTRNNQILEGMVAEAGIRVTRVPVQYATEFIPKYRDVQGAFEGMTHNPTATLASDPVSFLVQLYYSKGGIGFLGFDAANKGDGSGDPSVDAQIERATGEKDEQKRMAMVGDLQRYLAGKMYDMLFPGSSSTFSLAWPALNNFLAFGGDSPRSNDWKYLWLDPLKPPLNKT